MKKIKKSFLFSLIFGLLSALIFASTPSFGAVYASIDDYGTLSGYLQKQSTEVSGMQKLGTYQLYNSNTDTTSSYYSVVFTNLSSWILGSTAGVVSFNSTGLVAYGKLSSTTSNRAPRVTTIFSIGDKLLRAGQNGYLTMTLGASLYNGEGTESKDIDTSKLRIENGTKNTSDYTSFTSNSNLATSVGVTTTNTSGQYVTATINNPTQSDFRAVFVTERSNVGGFFTTKNCYLGVINPTITITSSDKQAPSISQYSMDTSWSNSSKELSITVTDSGAGVDYITLNNKTAKSVSKSDDHKTATFTFDVSENGDYTIVAYDNVGNSATYSYTIDCFDYDKPYFVSVIGDSQWSSDSRILTITIADALSGVSRLLVGDQEATFVETNGINSIYRYVIASNGDYELTFIDNANNSATYTYSETNFDITPPSISKLDTSCLWARDSKTLFISVVDGQIGVDRITIGTDECELVENIDGGKKFSYTIYSNGEYTITMYDSFDNVSTYTYIESYFDTTSSDVSLAIPTLSNNKEVVVNCSLTTDNKSSEIIYYTIDGSVPNTSSNELGVGENTIKFSANGDYVVKVAVIDQVGNSSQVKEYSIKVDDTRYSIFSNEFNCTLDIDNNPIDGEDGYYSYYGETITFTVSVNDNCLLYQVIVNGQEYEFADEYSVVCLGNITIEVRARQIIDIIDYEDEYVYNHEECGVDIEYTLNINEMLTIDYLYKIEDNEVDITEVQNVGNYTVVWSYSSDNYVGSGEFDITIIPKTVKLKTLEVTKVYGSIDPAFVFESDIPDGEILTAEFTRETGENVGEYVINLDSYSCSDNFVIEYTQGKLIIEPKNIYVFADSISKVYDDNDPQLTYKVYGNGLVGEDELSGSLTRVQGEDVGTYSILIGTLENSNYTINFAKGKFTITARQLIVNINNVSVEYGSSESQLSYTLVDEMDLDYTPRLDMITGSLIRECGDVVGDYTIGIGTLDSSNYVLKLSNSGVYSITSRPIVITADNVTKVYGEDDILSYQITEGELVNEDILTGDIVREKGENVGEYTILQGTLQNSNYSITFVPGKLEITPAPIEVIISNESKVYGQVDGLLSYSLKGVKNDDSVVVNLLRAEGEDAGEYQIDCLPITETNYYVSKLTKGVFTIHKAKIVPELSKKIFTYSINGFDFDCGDFPYDVSYIIKQNGIVVDKAVLDAGEYQVQVVFSGSANYESVTTPEVLVTVKKQIVYLTLGDNQFIYDGIIKFPTFKYDTSCGLDDNQISFQFENNASPINAGSYKFKIVSMDNNYDCTTEGVLVIAESFKVQNDREGIVECEDATFDSNLSQLQLIEKDIKGKFNDQKILTSCSFENVSDSDYVYTVKIKSRSDSKDIFVYQLDDDNTYRELVITQEDGYYIFKVDDLNDTYIITEKIEPIPAWVWLVVAVSGVILAFVTYKVVVTIVRKKKAKVNTSPDLDTYNLN